MRNQIIDNLRGLCLLGVIGIHVGSLAEPTKSFWLFTILEILSRYSVPTFFFISGFGLFCNDKHMLALAQGDTSIGDNFNYKNFIKRRLRSSGLPYLSWSILYRAYYTFIFPWGTIGWAPIYLAHDLVFGLCCYHLYFMVILIVFYLAHPLWRKLMSFMLRTTIPGCMAVLFVLQLVLFYWSSHNHINPDHWNVILKNLYVWRLNYVPLYYLFIFMLGGLMALYWDKVKVWLSKYFAAIIIFFLTTLLFIEGSAYYSYTRENYDLLSLAYTYHQLSLQGLLFTIGSILFFCALLLCYENSNGYLHRLVKLLSQYSMLMYFIHPFFLDIFTSCFTKFGIVMTVKRVTLAYFALVAVSLLASILLQKLFAYTPKLKLFFTGK